jgi:hypothetical protein
MFFRIGSFEFFIESEPKSSFFEIGHVKTGPLDREVWVFGWHVVISRIGPKFPRHASDGV